MSIAEDVEAHDAALNGEQVKVGQPLLVEEHLWVVKIAVQSDAQEEKERGDVDLVVPSSSIVMQDEIASLFIVLESAEMHCWLAIDFLLF